jgi:hypothetical protein
MINEDINIISCIRDIIFENFQMWEKMVWYVESLIVSTDLYICIMFLLFVKLGRNSNTVQLELSLIVQWMEFGSSPVTVLLNWNYFQYCVLPYIFFNIIDYCLLHY